MLSWFYNRFSLKHITKDIYGAVVAFARTPLFYTQMGVADTPEGRYEILVLHLFLVMERLRSLGGEGLNLSQELIDKFVVDMDDNMREMGVGDLTVPRKVKKAAAAFYDRVKVYRMGLEDANKETFKDILSNFVPTTKDQSIDLGALANHVLHLHKALEKQSLQTLGEFLMHSLTEISALEKTNKGGVLWS